MIQKSTLVDALLQGADLMDDGRSSENAFSFKRVLAKIIDQFGYNRRHVAVRVVVEDAERERLLSMILNSTIKFRPSQIDPKNRDSKMYINCTLTMK